jgi:hypothetical protein
MTVVNLNNIGKDLGQKLLALEWLIENLGPAGERWTFKDLTYVTFKKDRDATLFILKWS